MCHDTLEGHMRSNFMLAMNCNLDITAVGEMLPWERSTYLAMLIEHLMEQKKQSEGK